MTVGERKKQKTVADGMLGIAHGVVGSGPGGDLFRLLLGADTAAWQVIINARPRRFHASVLGQGYSVPSCVCARVL